jgi:1-deoxy-D-xylulose-5-phosphate reductoisomerase
MADITPEQALNHPNWDMGPKVTVDSATLMNKGLEVIEARWLFDLPISRISVLIHPQSVIHSMVEYRDGSIIAQMGVPHMITPIAYALSYPRHLSTPIAPLDFSQVRSLTFESPDSTRFHCLDLALRAADEGAGMPAVLNAANEIAVDAFLKGNLPFLSIPRLVERVMDRHPPRDLTSVEDVMATDAWARETALDLLASRVV